MEERLNKKRVREEECKKEYNSRENPKKQEIISSYEEKEIFKFSDSFRPLGVFDFPWDHKENLVYESEEFDCRDDVFYSYLSEEWNSPGEELCQATEPIEFPSEDLEDESWPSKEDVIDGADCIWSCVLSQPLSMPPSKLSNL